MRGVTACLVLLLAVEVAVGQQGTQNVCVPGKKTTISSKCVLTGTCPTLPSSGEEDCECVTHFNCRDKSVVKHGKGLIMIKNDIEPACQSKHEICCPKSQVVPKGGKTVPIAAAPSRSCGQRKRNGVGVQISGNTEGEAQFGEFPWMVALLKIENGEEKMLGGGALIHPRVVITAANKVDELQDDIAVLRARVGEWDTQSTSEPIPHQELEVEHVIVHEDFDKHVMFNDIALLVLKDAVTPSDNVGMLCLPDQGARSTSSKCVVTGWGSNEEGQRGCFLSLLKSIELPTIDRYNCQRMFRETALGPYFELHESFTCAGGKPGKDACVGDGGGALACPIPGDEQYYEQAGIVSWGMGCGIANVPGAYTDLSMYRDWVDAQFDTQNLNKRSYMRSAYKKRAAG